MISNFVSVEISTKALGIIQLSIHQQVITDQTLEESI